jgi:hypothetical protein
MRVDATRSVSELVDRFQTVARELAPVFEGEAVVGPVTDIVEAITVEVTDALDAETAG